MELKIRNFANITEMDLILDEKKLHFIYGISGSGKTSLARAMTIDESECDSYRTFGSSKPAEVSVNKKLDFIVFNEKAIQEYTFAKTGTGIYDVLYGENDELRALKNSLNGFLESDEMASIRAVIEKYKENFETLKSELHITTTGTGAISKTGLYKSLATPSKYYNDDSEMDISQRDWIKQGIEYISDDNCPFCSQPISETIVNSIKKIANNLPEELGKLVSAKNVLSSLNIDVDLKLINNEEQQQNLKNGIDSFHNTVKEMDSILNLLNISLNNDKDLTKKGKIKISKNTEIIFSNVGININEITDKLIKDKEGYSAQKNIYNSKLRGNIRDNIKKINKYFSEFGINYKFEKIDTLSRKSTYSLIHNDTDKDTSENLSTGEKNIIAIILFILSYKTKDVIIDDPASSFDEFRREKILYFILRERYSENIPKKMTIILSHDQIFLKFLTKDYMNPSGTKNVKFGKYIGNVLHFENLYSRCILKPINFGDIDSIIIHIKKQILASNVYLQKILNLRLFYENIDGNSIQYNYLSAILHAKRDGLTSKKLNELLNGRNTTEEKVLKIIKKDVDVVLEKYSEGNLDIELNCLSIFEQLCYIRDFVFSPEKKELNNVVHFNYALNHLLNPYKYNFQSKNSYLILQEYVSKLRKPI